MAVYIIIRKHNVPIMCIDVSDLQEQDPLADATYIRANFTYIPRTPKELQIKAGDVFHIHDEVCLYMFDHCQLSCLGSSVGRALAWEARSCGFESHLRQFVFPGLSQVLLCCVVCHLHCLTTFLISSNIHVYTYSLVF